MRGDKLRQVHAKILSKVLLTTLVACTSLVLIFGFEAPAQEDNTTLELNVPVSNMTEQNGFVSTISNRSAGVQANSEHPLTKQSMKPVIDSLFKAREELLLDNVVQSFDALNTASTELLKVIITQESNNDETHGLALTPLQRQVEFARSSLLTGNNTLAILHLNAADTEFIKISQELPSTYNEVQNIVNKTID